MPTRALAELAYEVAAKEAAWPVLPVIMADALTGEIVYCSRYAAATFGYETGELVGRPVEDLVPEEVRGQHAAWRRDVKAPATRLMGVGRQVLGRRRDGTLFPVHVGLTTMEALGRTIGVAFVIDLTGVMTSAQALAPAHGAEDRPKGE